MLPRLSLLEELRRGGYEASLITTFNAYLPFYEEVVLRHLIHAGVRHNVLLMDAQQYNISLQNHPPRLAGRRYTLVPISVPGAFHPKLIFLVGKYKGLVAVGSHNMTLAGFSFNRELTNVMRIRATGDEAGLQLAVRAWAEVTQWLDSSANKIPQQIVNMVRRVKDFAPWLTEKAPDTNGNVRLLAGRTGVPPLWEQVRQLTLPPVTDVFLTGAFFDSQLAFLKRLQQDLQPRQFVVALDPATVEIPNTQKEVPGVRFVHASTLGTDQERGQDGGTAGYLHAKGIFMRMANGDCVLVSGSANPSWPAWLATTTTGNTELMVARLGKDAETTAQAMGFTRIPDLPPLDERDWQTISENKHLNCPAKPSEAKFSIAVVVDDEVLIEAGLGDAFKDATIQLLDAEHHILAQSTRLTRIEANYAVTFPVEQLKSAVFLRCTTDTQKQADFLLHHMRVIEEQAQTGIQKRFKNALLSLQTDTPNISLLIECLDKIVFSDETACQSASPIHASNKRFESEDNPLAPETLAIDVSEVKRRKSKHRLSHSSDLAYLLDTLIFHLRLQEDRMKENVDRHGRSEEEQVGADDAEETRVENISEDDRIALLNLCHTKVRTVVQRMVKQLNAYNRGTQPLDAILFRLLGVLAVLRELRSCDGKVQWVEPGKTTVPPEERLHLFEEVMLNLFEGETSLLHLESLGNEIADSDDVARLKGLLLWLAWDSGLYFDTEKPFMETPEKLQKRLKTNAMLLALAQAVQTDDAVTREAQQSIGIFTTSDMDWLNAVCVLASRCEAAKQGGLETRHADKAEPGDIAIHRKPDNWDLRIVASASRDRVSLIKLSRENARVDYRPAYLLTTKLGLDTTSAPSS